MSDRLWVGYWPALTKVKKGSKMSTWEKVLGMPARPARCWGHPDAKFDLAWPAVV